MLVIFADFSTFSLNFTKIADFSVKISLIFIGISGNCRQLPEKNHYLLHQILEIREKMVQKIMTSGNCLQFPEIPTKINEIFNEKSAISANGGFFDLLTP